MTIAHNPHECVEGARALGEPSARNGAPVPCQRVHAPRAGVAATGRYSTLLNGTHDCQELCQPLEKERLWRL